MEFESSNYRVLWSAGLANMTLALSGQVISQSFNVTVITTDCASPPAPAIGSHDSISHYLIVYLIVCNPLLHNHAMGCCLIKNDLCDNANPFIMMIKSFVIVMAKLHMYVHT